MRETSFWEREWKTDILSEYLAWFVVVTVVEADCSYLRKGGRYIFSMLLCSLWNMPFDREPTSRFLHCINGIVPLTVRV